MITASVGFQCPECAHAGAQRSRTVRVGRTALTRTPTVTYTLLALNVMVYLAGIAGDLRATPGTSFTARFSLWTPLVGNGEWYRIFTGGFMHAGGLHLAMNMAALYFIGGQLEQILGHARYLAVYLASLCGGALGVVLLFRAGEGPTVGASGAIFGILGAFLALQLAMGQNPMRSDLGLLVALNLVITFSVPGISIGGHLGGLIVGAACGGLLVAGTPPAAQSHQERTVRNAAVVVVGLACLAAAVVVAQARFGVA
jgi:membrane associated rhomboid family serine protease